MINDTVWYPIDMEPDPGAAGPNGQAGYGGGFIDVLDLGQRHHPLRLGPDA